MRNTVRALCLLAVSAAQAVAGPIDVLTDTRLGDARRDALERATAEAEAFIEDQTGERLTGRFVVLGADANSVSRVLDAGYERLEKPRPVVRVSMQQLCGGGRANGIASHDFILICWPRGPTKYRPNHLPALMVHEMFHQLQYDLSNSRADSPGQGPRRLGPAWLVEGSAEVLEYIYLRGALPEDGPDLFQLQAPARRGRVTLSDMSAHGTVRDFYSYGAARFAASLLARSHGIEGFIRYFTNLRRGQSQEVAFQRAFGQSLEEFELAFEAVRRDFGAARDWRAKR